MYSTYYDLNYCGLLSVALAKDSGVCWTMSELSLNKIQRILLIDPPSVSARLTASKTENFSLHFFNRAPPKFFSIKEMKIFLFCFPADAGIAETLSHPIPPSAESRRAKIPSPQPPSFLPACWKPPAIFSDGDGTSNWVAGGVNYLNNNTTKQIPKAKYKTPNIRGIHNST